MEGLPVSIERNQLSYALCTLATISKSNKFNEQNESQRLESKNAANDIIKNYNTFKLEKATLRVWLGFPPPTSHLFWRSTYHVPPFVRT